MGHNECGALDPPPEFCPMSDLILSYENLAVPPSACTETPPEPSTRGSRGSDGCFLTLGLVDDTNPSATPRLVRFDRAGDQFILSASNSESIRGWFETHTNTLALFDTLRLTGAMLRGYPSSMRAETIRVLFVISQFVSTGLVRTSAREETTMDRGDLANGLLEIFTDSGEEVLGPVLGQLQVARRSAWVSEEGVERIRWVTSILDLVPSYRLFRGNFLDENELDHFAELSPDHQEQIGVLSNFLRNIVVRHSADLPLRFSQSFIAAHDAYRELYSDDISAGRRMEFCATLSQALQVLRGERGGSGSFLEECSEALRLRDLSPEAALRESMRAVLLSPAGLRALQDSIQAESDDAEMTVSWLRERGDSENGRIGEVLEIFFRHLQVHYSDDPEAPPTLSMDVPALSLEWSTLLDAHVTTRREYLLAILALARRLFGSDGNAPALRVFVRDSFAEVSWNFSESELHSLRTFLASLGTRREDSQEQSDIWLPILEGAVCALGIGGLFATELTPDISRDEGLHLGLGTSSAGLAGAGCSSLLGHYVWPEIGEVHNRYLWEGLTGLGGAVVGVGLYLLLHFLTGGSSGTGPGTRFPVDEYGP